MIKVYELNLPVIDVSVKNNEISEPESLLGDYLGPITSTSIDEIIQENIDQQFDKATNNNEENDWVKDNQTLGELGELLAEAYLKDHYETVKIVSENAKLGYDIEVFTNQQQLQFEVKTAQNHFGFHITKNELVKASIFQGSYHLFFIKLNEEDKDNIQIDGYIIQNPIKKFDLDIDELLLISKKPCISYQANRFFISLVPSTLGTKLDLSYLV